MNDSEEFPPDMLRMNLNVTPEERAIRLQEICRQAWQKKLNNYKGMIKYLEEFEAEMTQEDA
jgi:hypothetical protein